MHILYVEHYAGTPKLGMEYRPFYLAREWIKLGHTVTIIASSYSHLRSTNPKTIQKITVDTVEGVDFIWCRGPEYAGNGVKRLLNILSFIRSIEKAASFSVRPPDVVISSSTYPVDIYACARLARTNHAKLVWEVHDLWPMSPMSLYGFSKYHPLMQWFQKAEDFACRNSDIIVSILPRTDRHLLHRGMAPEKYFHVPNGISLQEWGESEYDQGKSEQLSVIERLRSNGRKVILYTGSHTAANALDVALDCAAATSDLSCIWVFVGSGMEKPQLRERIQRERITNVLLLDPVAKNQIPPLLQSADILYIGWRREKLYDYGISANKIFDYMMSGTPIIHSVSAANDPIKEAKCGISVEPESPKRIKWAVEHMLSLSDKERNIMGENGRKYIETHHTYSSLAQKFIDIMTNHKSFDKTGTAINVTADSKH